MKVLLRLWLALTLCLVTVNLAQAAPLTQQNLLSNPGFESSYEGGVATGWFAWAQTGRRPDFSEAAASGGRLHSGNNAQKISVVAATFDAGVYQQISGVVVGQKYRFTNFMQGVASSAQISLGMQIGLDPNGGTNALSSDVVWSATDSTLNAWATLTVEATAKSSVLTAFIRAAPKSAIARTEIYIDDAALYAIFTNSDPASGVPPITAVTLFVTETATVRVTPTWPATSTPRPNGEVWYTVRSGDTLIVIAFYHKVTVDSIKQLNNLTTNSILPGQRLLIAMVTPPATVAALLTPQATFTPSNTPELVRLPTETPRPLIVSPNYGQVCVIAYNDTNANGRNENESLLAGVRVTLSDASNKPLDNYVTSLEQKCFGQLAPSSYKLSVTAPAGYTPTTASEATLQVEGGKAVTLVFGLTKVAPAEAASPSSSPLLLIIFVLSTTVFFILVIGMAVVLFTKKK